MNKVALAGIITVIHSLTDVKNIILGDYHYTMLYLGLAAYPRMLYTVQTTITIKCLTILYFELTSFCLFKKVDENNENKPVSLRVGQAVDIVGQAGKPKKITGF